MLYLFKAVSRSDLRNTRKLISSFPRYTVRINADSIEQATAQVAPFFVILAVHEANSHLIKKSVSGSIAGTTNTDANRKRYSRGIFLSQIYLSQGEHRPRNIKFAVRLICGNKASNCTNNASRSVSVVETLSHLLGDISNLLTNTETITMKIYSKSTALLGAVYPIAAFLSQYKFTFCLAMAEVQNG